MTRSLSVFSTPTSNKTHPEKIDETPNSRAGQESEKLSAKGRDRVDAAGPNRVRCTIQNSPANAGVQFAHIFPRRMMKGSDDLVERIERNWNMPQGTLNLDTRLNVIKLNVTLHQLHDARCWLLLPQKKIIEKHYNAVTQDDQIISGRFTMPDELTKTRKIGPQKSYIYDFVIQDETAMREHVIYVQKDTPKTTGDVKVHVYPYSNLPPIRSHLHPRYAILEAGRRLEHGDVDDEELSGVDEDIQDQLRTIYKAWTREPDVMDLDKPDATSAGTNAPGGDDDGADDDDDNASDATGRRSTRSQTRSRANGKRGNDGSPSHRSAGKRSRTGNSGGQEAGENHAQDCDCGASCLSGDTLYEHDATSGTQSWDKGRIDTWANGVVGEHDGDVVA